MLDMFPGRSFQIYIRPCGHATKGPPLAARRSWPFALAVRETKVEPPEPGVGNRSSWSQSGEIESPLACLHPLLLLTAVQHSTIILRAKPCGNSSMSANVAATRLTLTTSPR